MSAGLIAALLLAGACGPTPNVADVPFLWGAATSSYQVEGVVDCDLPDRPCNDYDFFNRHPTIHDVVASNTKQDGLAADIAPAGRAVDFAKPEIYRRDFDNARLLGLNAFRISLEWARLEPERDAFRDEVLDAYRAMIKAMRDRGLEPIVTLNHFTLPIWVLRPPAQTWTTLEFLGGVKRLQYPHDDDPAFQASLRGWETTDTLEEWSEYVAYVVDGLGDLVDYWLTVNEPVGSQVGVGYLGGVWSPGFVSDDPKARAVLRNLIEAHVRAYDLIKRCDGGTRCDDHDANGDGRPALVGFAHAMGVTVPGPGGLIGDNVRAASNYSYFLNDYFLNAVVDGNEDTEYLTSLGARQGGEPTHHPAWEGRLDFVGVNYYRRFHVSFDLGLQVAGSGYVGGRFPNNMWGEHLDHEMLNDLGWAIYPQGLYETIMKVKEEWDLPVLVTENGLPERHNLNRAPHLVAHIAAIQRAMDDGAEVMGYLYWSIMDNWELHEQYRPEAQFGLFHVDRSDGALQRQLTEGALAYRYVVAESRRRDTSGRPTSDAVTAAQERFGAIEANGSSVVPPTKSHGRAWQGTTAAGDRFTLYLTAVGPLGDIVGLIGWPGNVWHDVELKMDDQGAFLRESWYGEDAPSERQHRVTFANGDWVGTFGGSEEVSAELRPATGTWVWQEDSPWGGASFSIAELGENPVGKYLTYSNPSDGLDDPACAIVCKTDPAGPVWRALTPTLGDGVRLEAIGEGETAFDLSMAYRTPDELETTVARSGSFEASRVGTVLALPFVETGYVSPAGDWWWTGTRDRSPTSTFRLSERRSLALERPKDPAPIGGRDDQYYRVNDPTAIMPLDAFNQLTTALGTRANFSWAAGGRAYEIRDAVFQDLGFCFPRACTGTWADIGGTVAQRASDKLPPVAYAGPDQTIQMTGNRSVAVTLDGSRSFDLSGGSLEFAWSGPFGTQAGTGVVVDLPLGEHEICLQVTNSEGLASRDCLKVSIARGHQPDRSLPTESHPGAGG